MIGDEHMAKVACPHCGSEVDVVYFGVGYIAVCCDQVIYVSDRLPGRREKDHDSGE